MTEEIMRQRYQSLPVKNLREIAKSRGISGISNIRKEPLIERLISQDKEENLYETPAAAQAEEKPAKASEPAKVAADAVAAVQKTEEKAEAVQRASAPEVNAEKPKPTGKNREDSRRKSGKEASAEKPARKQRKKSAEAEGETQNVRQPEERRRRENSGREKENAGNENTGRAEGGKLREAAQNREAVQNRESRENAGRENSRTRENNASREEGRSRESAVRENLKRREIPVSREDARNRDNAGREDVRNRDNVVREETRNRDNTGREDVRNRDNIVREDVRNREYTAREDVRNRDNASREDMRNRDDGRTREDARVREAAKPREGENEEELQEELIRRELHDLDSGVERSGVMEVMTEGFGFIRSDNYLPGSEDIYISPTQIKRFRLKTGDFVCGNIRTKTQNEKFSALLYVKSVNGLPPAVNAKRPNFEDMTPIFPNERIHLERPQGSIAMRIVDLVSPIGKGQRGMIVSPPKAGKTTLLKDMARSILRNNPEMHIIILLIDERPEEVTDIKETVVGDNVEVIYSTFDETPDHHRKVSEMVIERAKRLVENHRDVIIFIDSITRLARAYNQVVPPSGRTLSGGLDPASLHMPKRFFGAARNMREGGSLTILATALVDTGSKMDDVVYEEFKGTGNMELILDRKLQERRVFPAIDLARSGTRREDLLLTREEQEAVNHMRRALTGLKAEEAGENILSMFARTRTNADLVQMLRRQRIV